MRSAFAHDGAGKILVHRLKYEGVVAAAELLACALLPFVPPGAGGLVPVPRSAMRRVRYGVDPAFEISRALSRRTGLPTHSSALAPLWGSGQHAGRGRSGRSVPSFRVGTPLPVSPVLVDDVVTTGATLMGLAKALGLTGVTALTATAALGVTSLNERGRRPE